MNTSSRMESTSKPGCIQISKATYSLLDEEDQEPFNATGGIEIKVREVSDTRH